MIEKLTDEERHQMVDTNVEPSVALCAKALRIIDAQAAEMERMESARIKRMEALLDEALSFVISDRLRISIELELANEPQNGQPIRPPK